MSSDGGTRDSRKAQQRHRILDAARGVFFRDGFMQANLDEVASIAGVAKGTLYRYFENKADLYVAILAENGQVFEERMREAGTGPGSAGDRLRSISRFYFTHWTQHSEYFQIFWALENQNVIGDLPEELVGDVTQLWEKCLGILEGVIRDGVDAGEFAKCDPWEVANILWTVGNGLIQTELVAPRRELRGKPLEEVFKDMVELFLRGLARESDASGGPG